MLSGVCRRLSSSFVVCRLSLSVTLHGAIIRLKDGFTRAGQAMMSCRLQSNYSFTVTVTLHGGPVEFRPVRATPCSLILNYSNLAWVVWRRVMSSTPRFRQRPWMFGNCRRSRDESVAEIPAAHWSHPYPDSQRRKKTYEPGGVLRVHKTPREKKN